MKNSLAFLILIFFTTLLSASAIYGDSSTPLKLMQPQQKNQTGAGTAAPTTVEPLHDIHGPVETVNYPPYILLLTVLILAVPALVALYIFIKKRRRSTPPPILPWQKALNELAEARKSFSPKESLAYMEKISLILRHYIEARFAIPSTRRTTEEFLQNMRNFHGNSPLRQFLDDLQSCLEQCDLAKFAHCPPDDQTLSKLDQDITSFIRRTTPLDRQQQEEKS